MIQSKKWSRLVSGVMAVGFVAVGSLQYTDYVLAAEEAGNAEIAYVEDVITLYLKNTEYAAMTNVTLSDAIPYYDFENGTEVANEYIAYFDDIVIGVLYVNKVDGEYYSNFRKSDFECIQEAFDDNSEVALGWYDNVDVLFDGEKFYQMDTSELNDNEIDVDGIELTSLCQVYDEFSSALSPLSDGTVSAYCSVEPVSNKSIDNNGGICWASSIAAKYNYVNFYSQGDSGYVDGEVVYNVVKNVDSCIPTGNSTNIENGLHYFGLFNSFAEDTMTATEIYAELVWDNPILISIFQNTTSSGGHMVIISGISCTTSSATYTIVDPNYLSPVDVVVDLQTMNNGANFVYRQYRNWRCTFSYKFAPGT